MASVTGESKVMKVEMGPYLSCITLQLVTTLWDVGLVVPTLCLDSELLDPSVLVPSSSTLKPLSSIQYGGIGCVQPPDWQLVTTIKMEL